MILEAIARRVRSEAGAALSWAAASNTVATSFSKAGERDMALETAAPPNGSDAGTGRAGGVETKKDADPGEVQRPTTPLSPQRAISTRDGETQRGGLITPSACYRIVTLSYKWLSGLAKLPTAGAGFRWRLGAPASQASRVKFGALRFTCRFLFARFCGPSTRARTVAGCIGFPPSANCSPIALRVSPWPRSSWARLARSG
jgi:hypothetical protein